MRMRATPSCARNLRFIVRRCCRFVRQLRVILRLLVGEALLQALATDGVVSPRCKRTPSDGLVDHRELGKARQRLLATLRASTLV